MTVLTLVLALAQAAPMPPPPPGEGMRSWREQVFISPAGEPFRVPEGQPYPVAAWFNQADLNHDGKLSEAEFIADFQRFAAILDTDHDGIIEGTEVEAYETVMVPEVHSGATLSYSTEGGGDGEGGGSSHGPPADSQPMGAGKYGLLNLPEPVAAMDTGLTGRITKRDVTSAAIYRFSLLDKDERGWLTLADLPETFAQGHKGQVRRRHRR